MGMFQVKLRGWLEELFEGDGVPNVGGELAFVVKLYQRLRYWPLPVGSVALT